MMGQIWIDSVAAMDFFQMEIWMRMIVQLDADALHVTWEWEIRIWLIVEILFANIGWI